MESDPQTIPASPASAETAATASQMPEAGEVVGAVCPWCGYPWRAGAATCLACGFDHADAATWLSARGYDATMLSEPVPAEPRRRWALRGRWVLVVAALWWAGWVLLDLVQRWNAVYARASDLGVRLPNDPKYLPTAPVIEATAVTLLWGLVAVLHLLAAIGVWRVRGWGLALCVLLGAFQLALVGEILTHATHGSLLPLVDNAVMGGVLLLGVVAMDRWGLLPTQNLAMRAYLRIAWRRALRRALLVTVIFMSLVIIVLVAMDAPYLSAWLLAAGIVAFILFILDLLIPLERRLPSGAWWQAHTQLPVPATAPTEEPMA